MTVLNFYNHEGHEDHEGIFSMLLSPFVFLLIVIPAKAGIHWSRLQEIPDNSSCSFSFSLSLFFYTVNPACSKRLDRLLETG